MFPEFGSKSTGSFAVSAFASGNPRDTFKASPNPPPNTYHPVDDPKYMVRGRIQDNFGADAKREQLFHRDLVKSPFKNRSSYYETVGPGSYKTSEGFHKMVPEDVNISAAGVANQTTYSSAYQ